MYECDILSDEPKELNDRSILSNIYIMGGAPRDILLNADINDIDISIDTQKLNILHLNHLNKFHSSHKQQSANSSCIFWKLYLKKFEKKYKNKLHRNQTKRILPNNCRVKIGYFQNINRDDDYKENASHSDGITVNTRNILDSNYMLNSKYFTDIISQSVQLKKYVDVVIYAKDLFRLNEIQINKDIVYNGINLKGQCIDFLDAVKRNANMNIIQHYEKTEFNKLYPNKYLYSECRKYHFKDKITTKDGLIDIQMEIYNVSAMEAILKADLSLNTLWVDCLSVLCGTNDDGADNIDLNWYNKINNCRLLIGYDTKHDFKNKIITHPYLHQTVLIQRPKYHFFRIIKMYIKLGDEWTIDSNLIDVTKKYFYLWLNNEEFWDDNNENGYQHILWNLFDRDRYSPSNADELYLMLEAFKMFDVNTILINKLKQVEGFMFGFLESLKNTSIDMIKLYKTYGYPCDCN